MITRREFFANFLSVLPVRKAPDIRRPNLENYFNHIGFLFAVSTYEGMEHLRGLNRERIEAFIQKGKLLPDYAFDLSKINGNGFARKRYRQRPQ
jgi:hypothetical protein